MKDDRLYLGHILEAIERILVYGGDGEETFRRELKTQDAIIRNLQVMGEAVKKVSRETRAEHPEIPWKDISGMRDRVVHDYLAYPSISSGMSSRTTSLHCKRSFAALSMN